MPKIAGMESSANRMSVEPIAIITMSKGVTTRLPSTRVMILAPSYSCVVGRTRSIRRSTGFLLSSGSSSRCRASWMAVKIRKAPKM